MDDAAARREQTRRAAEAHVAAHQRRRAAEAAQARALIAGFVEEAGRRGLRPGRLAARAYGGSATYRTGRRGWYLTPDRTIAVGDDREFYILTVPASLRARLTGAVVEPHEPTLVINEGGRDGESMPLAELLRRRLDAGADRP
jgi:hypothetical protein